MTLHTLRPCWRRTSLRTKIYLGYLALLSLPLLVVAWAAYQTSATTIKRNARDFSAQLTAEIRTNLDAYERDAERLTYWPFQATDIQNVLRSYQSASNRMPGADHSAVMKTELESIGRLGRYQADIDGIYVVTRNGTLFSWTASGYLRPSPPTTNASWYRAALEASPRTVFLPTHGQDMIGVATDKVFSLVRALCDNRTGAVLGAVRVDLDAAALATVVQRVSLGMQGQLLVLAPSGTVVYPIDPTPATERLARAIARHRSDAPGGVLQFDVNGRALLATYNRSAWSGWIVAGVVPVDQLLSGANYLRAFILTVAALCILCGALCATFIVARLTQPLRQLRGAMRRVEARDLTARIAVESEDEVGQLARGFNTMLDELRRLVDDVLRAQIHEREAELHALQNQINPHFLYNTLESINMLALTHGDRDISRMVTSLGRLLRLTLSSSATLISLRDELHYVEHYLVVQRMRYGDRIHMTVDVTPDVLDYQLPRLTLQPIVENALYHGLEPQRGIGHVVVRGRKEGTDLVLSVEDDGVGMDEGALARLRARLQRPVTHGGRSIGLANVEQRIKLYCGDDYGLAIASAPGRGTTVTVRIPQTLRLQEQPLPQIGPAHVPDHKEDMSVSLAHRRR